MPHARGSDSEEDDANSPPSRPPVLLAILSCCVVCVAAFSQGVLLMWVNPVLPQLVNGTDHDDHLPPLDEVKLSFVTSAHNIGSMVGAALSGLVLLLAKYLGLHRLFPLLALFSCLSWLLLSIVPHYQAVIAGRALAGLFVTTLASLSPNYIATVAPEAYRAPMLSTFNVVRNVGMNVTALVGAYLSWPVMSNVFGTIPPVIILLSFWFLQPVTNNPYKTLENQVSTSSDFSVRTDEEEEESQDFDDRANLLPPTRSKTTILKSALRLIFLGSVYSLSGTCPLTSFTSDLIPCHPVNRNNTLDMETNNTLYYRASPLVLTRSDPHLTTTSACTTAYPYTYSAATIAFLTCNLLGSMISTLVSKHLSQRAILITTNTILVISTATLSVYYFYLPCTFGNTIFCYIPIIICIIFFTAIGIGIGTLFTVYLGDLPEEGQSVSLPAVLVWLNLMNYLQNQLFLLVLDWAGELALPGMFLFHTLANLLALLYSCCSRLEICPDPSTATDPGFMRIFTYRDEDLLSVAHRQSFRSSSAVI